MKPVTIKQFLKAQILYLDIGEIIYRGYNMSLIGAVKAFNKVGARLLTKEAGVKFTSGQRLFHGVSLPEGAISGSFVQGELKFGKEGFSILSFFDKEGRLIDRRRFNIINGQAQEKSHSIYTNSKVRASQHNGKLKTEQKLFRRTTFDREKETNECLNIFIDDMHTDAPKVTRAITTYEPLGGNKYAEKVRGALGDFPPIPTVADRFTFSIEEFGKGIKHKLFKSKVDYSRANGHFYTFKTPIETRNLTEEEIAQLSADRYLPLKIHSGINRYKFLKRDVFENMGVHPDFPVKYEKSQGFGYRDGAYRPDHDKFVFTIGQNERIQIPFETTISTLAHETRHKHQYDLMHEYSAIVSSIHSGRKTAKDLESMKELELAKKFIEDWGENDFNKLVGRYKYNKDGLEVDAFAYEKEYRQRFYKDEAPISKIFNAIGMHWLMR